MTIPLFKQKFKEFKQVKILSLFGLYAQLPSPAFNTKQGI